MKIKLQQISKRRFGTVAGAAVLSVIVISAALGQASARKLFLNLGGQSYPVSVVSMNGRSYISLDSLKEAGATVTESSATAGGANQVSAIEGILGQTLFNGAWRLTVKKVTKLTDTYGRPEVDIAYEVRNGSNITTDLPDTGFESNAHSMVLVLANGNSVTPVDFLGFSKDIPPGGSFAFTLTYNPEKSDADQVPARVLAVVKPEKRQYSGLKVHYSVKDPSFRIDLTKGQ